MPWARRFSAPRCAVQVPRPQVRSVAHPRLLPHVRGVRAHATGRAANAFLDQENRVGKEGETATRKLLAFATDKHNALYNKQEFAARAWFAGWHKYLDEKARQKLPDEEKPPRLVGLSPEEQGRRRCAGGRVDLGTTPRALPTAGAIRVQRACAEFPERPQAAHERAR